MPWAVNDQGCCCEAGCTNYIPCCVTGLQFDVFTGRDGDFAFNQMVFTAAGPGFSTDNWAIGDPVISPRTGKPVYSTGNIICHHPEFDASLLLCPVSANDEVVITSRFINCTGAKRTLTIEAAQVTIHFWEGGDPDGGEGNSCGTIGTGTGPQAGFQTAGIPCCMNLIAPDQSPDPTQVLEITLADGAEAEFTWTFPLPMSCPEYCLQESTMEEWIAEYGSKPPVVSAPPIINDGFGALQRICYYLSCTGNINGVPFDPVGRVFYENCFGTNVQTDCNLNDPLPCPDCYWAELFRVTGLRSPPVTRYGDDNFIDCNCGCKNCIPGRLNAKCPPPPKQAFDSGMHTTMRSGGVVNVCLDDLIGGSVWIGKNDDDCFKKTDPFPSSFGGGCYDSPVPGAPVCLFNRFDDPWFDITAGATPCDTVGIEWESIKLGPGSYEICLTIHAGGIGGWQAERYCEFRLPGVDPVGFGNVYWERDNHCGQAENIIRRPEGLILPKVGIGKAITRWKPPRF